MITLPPLFRDLIRMITLAKVDGVDTPITFQLINDCITQIQDRKRPEPHTSITFATTEVTTQQLFDGTAPVAPILLWVNRDKYNQVHVDRTLMLSLTASELDNLRIVAEQLQQLHNPTPEMLQFIAMVNNPME